MDESTFYRLFQRLSDYYILSRTRALLLLDLILQRLNNTGSFPALRDPNDEAEKDDTS